MEPTLIKEEKLDNGVTLRLFDASRKLAGDRWLVALTIHALVPVGENAAPPVDAGPPVRQLLGDTITFEQKRERYFIDEQQKPAVLTRMLESFQAMTRDYLAHPGFPSRFIKKSYQDQLTKKQLEDRMNSRG